MKKLLAISLCILMLALCGCQPTPDDEYVVNKGDNTAEEKINATPLPTSAVGTAPVGTEPADTENTEVDHGFENAAYQPVFPEHWDDSIKTDYKEIIINADITTSGQLSYPVHLVKRHAETTEERNRLGNILFPENIVPGIAPGVLCY